MDRSFWLKLGAEIVALAIAVTTLGVTITAHLNARFHEIDKQLMVITYSIENPWKAQDMEVWSLRLRVNNPSIDVPDPREVVNSRKVNR
jgi:hypothetical protein